ncbi:hypothetical protein [Pseudodonghicola xiamenensis]|uniref:Uncharacterized protein n=1 Tax=Pseudodonghicola xiamenensis TaxID=337702 RepID=A0A8J3H507_9RHOB|nr:hypothetical protein [Pseudodonghicola xiamenensis]GHG87550.1 hypothetical protein GCM10010961_16070 [Pseudodonghicola xiamenensis]
MSLSFRLFPNRGLVYVRYEGFARLDDTLQAFARYAADPRTRPGQKQLVDLAAVTGYEQDFTKLMQIQAQKADVFAANGVQTLMVYYAPTPLARDFANLALRSWNSFDVVVALIQNDEAQSLELLGQPERSFSDLLQNA